MSNNNSGHQSSEEKHDKQNKHDHQENHDQHNDHNKHQNHDHGDHHKHMVKDFRRRFWISLAATIPLLFLSSMIQDWFGYTFDFEGKGYVIFAIATFLFFYGGWPFLKGLFNELKEKQPGMMTLIALAITVAYVYSSAIVFGLSGKPFFWELATLIVVMLAGHWIEMKSVMQASGALDKLMELMPDTAHKITDDGTEEIKVNKLKEDDKVLVKPGEKIPTDGIIYEGSSSVDESVITGESKPVKKKKDDEVVGGSINGNSSIKIKVKSSQDDSYLSKVIGMVQEAKKKKSKTQHLADRAAFWLTIIAITAGTITLAVWLFVGKDFNFALTRMVTVMVIACPHALGLAIPLVVAISTSESAKNGLLVRNRTAFENSRKIDTVVFDKTGTLTLGEYGISRYESLQDDMDKVELLKLAAGLEKESEHPIATGILKKAEEEELDIPDSEDMENMTGEGVKGKVNGEDVKIVSPAYLDKNNIEVKDKPKPDKTETLVYVLIDDEPAGYIGLSDKLRETSKEAIKNLKEMEIESWILTGDNEEVTKSIADELDLKGYFAEVLPDQKQDKIKELQKEGKFVAMTGDGVNDAPALAQADVGIAIGSGTDVAAETADIILVESDPMDVTKLIGFGRATHKKMIQNLIYATAYNVVALPLGAGVLFWAGIMINPAVGAILMSLSTVAVAINAQFLKKKLN
ncbi:MAG: cadmium-translocating P-type ATPase [Bacteroidales bacterium]|nr:cadmium-translocating P-type ATPase [Bacteroidales bacterium]MCF8352008.1 cadmium-translocating P-type ATPase [Bacteroidales bacterium]MCF8376579.1 cadmium-translocating P-type ATPase [Bacteroidales bacterium]MCF8401164.1 cadmium-translocating P-type ATPase [Bacteroidales bacterium]